MIINKYGICLKSLLLEDIEIVRQWRNLEHVRLNMVYNKCISFKEQKMWFAKLNNNQHYYLILKDNTKIGLINVKNIDFSMKTGEAGIFIGNYKFAKNPIALNAILALMDYYFEDLKFTSLHAKVLKKNTNALQMNQKLGYKITHQDSICYYLKVEKEWYLKTTSSFKSLLL